MSNLMHAARAYRTVSAIRSLREQEADVFRRATGTLRAARDAGPLDRVKALADTQRLWTMVRALARDPDNQLDASLRGALISVALSVQRELDSGSPNVDFLIAVNENIAAGLST